MQHRVSRKEFMTLFFGGISLVFVLGISTIILLTYAGMTSNFTSLTILSSIHLCLEEFFSS